MGFQELADLDCSTTTALGGTDKKSGKKNPTTIEGYYIGTRQVASPKSKTGFSALHIFQTQKGNVGVWGKKNLDDKMAFVTPGQMIRATFTGMMETKNNPMYKYKVEVDKDNTIEVSASTSGNVAGNGTESAYDTAGSDEYADDVDLDSDDTTAADEVPPSRPVRPTRPAQAPSAGQQARVAALLGKRPA